MIDLIYIGWMIITALLSSKIPFYADFVNDISAAQSFGVAYPVFLVIITYVMMVSVIISGYLMVRNNRIGVYISLMQTPFRLFLVLPPTLFFLVYFNPPPSLSIIIVVLVLLFDVIKAITLVQWLKRNRRETAKNYSGT